MQGMINLCAASDLIVTPDSGTLHVAGALGKKTLALFGCINPRTRISYYKNMTVLYPHGELPCIPCHDLHPCMDGKPEDGVRCMKMLTPKKITDATIGMTKGGS